MKLEARLKDAENSNRVRYLINNCKRVNITVGDSD